MVESNETNKNYEMKKPTSRFCVYLNLKIIKLHIREYLSNEL